MNFEALLKKKREVEVLRGQMERNALRSFEQDFLIEYTHNSTAIEYADAASDESCFGGWHLSRRKDLARDL